MSRVVEVGYDYIKIAPEKESCEFCKYYRRLQHNFVRGEGFKESHCCDVLYHLPEDDEEAWIQEVSGDGMCEMFTRREK